MPTRVTRGAIITERSRKYGNSPSLFCAGAVQIPAAGTRAVASRTDRGTANGRKSTEKTRAGKTRSPNGRGRARGANASRTSASGANRRDALRAAPKKVKKGVPARPRVRENPGTLPKRAPPNPAAVELDLFDAEQTAEQRSKNPRRMYHDDFHYGRPFIQIGGRTPDSILCAFAPARETAIRTKRKIVFVSFLENARSLLQGKREMMYNLFT